MRKTLIFGILVMVFILSGCAHRQADLTLVSTRNVRYENILAARKAQNPATVEGYDLQHLVLIFPVSATPNLEEAIDDAMDQAHGDCMIDAVVYSYGWYIPLIYGQSGWKVTGKVVNTYMPGLEEK